MSTIPTALKMRAQESKVQHYFAACTSIVKLWFGVPMRRADRKDFFLAARG
jgi:hypothetical protein